MDEVGTFRGHGPVPRPFTLGIEERNLAPALQCRGKQRYDRLVLTIGGADGRLVDGTPELEVVDVRASDVQAV